MMPWTNSRMRWALATRSRTWAVSRTGVTVPSGDTSAAPRIGYGKSSPTTLLITFWKKILIAPPSDRRVDQRRREPVEGDHGRVRGAALHPAEREEELAVVGDGEHVLVAVQRQRDGHPERRLGGDDRRVGHVGQLQDAEAGVVAPAGGEGQGLGHARVVVEQPGQRDVAQVARGEGRGRQPGVGLEGGVAFQLDAAGRASRPGRGRGRASSPAAGPS